MSDGQQMTKLGQWSVSLVLCGAFWLVLQLGLRGGAPVIRLCLPLIVVLVTAAIVIGIATNPRASIAGEVLMAKEMLCFGLVAIFCMPAVMLGVYIVVTLASVGLYLGSWSVWCVVCLAAVIITVALWCGLIGGGLAILAGLGDEALRPEVLPSGALAVGLTLGAAYGLRWWLACGMGTVFSGGLCSHAEAWREWIKPWSYIIDGLRNEIAFIDYNRAMSLTASGAIGVGSGLVLALGLRHLRQISMRRPAWRGLLPNAVAPLPDGAPWLPAELVGPAIGLMALLWLAFLWETLL